VLRLLIERQGADPDTGSGVDVGLCASVSRELSAVLDVSDPVAGSYTLEVSSPGIERPLVRQSDFERFIGKVASIKTSVPVLGRRTFKGRLKGVKNGAVLLEGADNQSIAIPGDVIKKANLVFELRN
jgi:ribosome maturation factor RimP